MTTIGVLVLVLAQATAPGASLSGRVTDRATGRPVPRMIVTAIGADLKQGHEAVTDAEGRYDLTGLAAGAYAVRVTHDEHRSTYLSQWFGDTVRSGTYFTPPRLNVTLAAGERRGDVDVALTRALAIEGRVLDPWGDPSPGAEVLVRQADGKSLPDGGATTNDLGEFRAFGLAPGRYRVCATPGSAAEPRPADIAAPVRTCYPSAVTESNASDVTLASQDALDVEIRIQRVGTLGISGVVTDAAGLPVDGAYVSALPVEESSQSGSARTVAGTFTIKGLAPGRYSIVASIGGARLGDPDPPAREREAGYVTADLVASDAANVTITITKPVALSGVLRFEGAAAPPAGSARVRIATPVPEGQRPWMSENLQLADVKDDLSFTVGGLYRRSLNLFVHGLPDGWALKSVRLGDRDITYTATDLAAAPSARLEIVLTNRVASPSVKPVDERGEIVPAATVVALPASPDRWAAPMVTMPDATPRDGALKLGAMLPGDYFIAAIPIEDSGILFRNPSRAASVAAIGTKVTLGAGDTRVLTIRVTPLPDK